METQPKVLKKMVYKDGIKVHKKLIESAAEPKSKYNLKENAFYRIWFVWKSGKRSVFYSLDTIGAKKTCCSKEKGLSRLRNLIKKHENQIDVYRIYDNQPPDTNVLREECKNGVITFKNWDK